MPNAVDNVFAIPRRGLRVQGTNAKYDVTLNIEKRDRNVQSMFYFKCAAHSELGLALHEPGLLN